MYFTTVRTQLQDNENMQTFNTISKLDKISLLHDGRLRALFTCRQV